jgi:glycosyltransferase involved in cell wall biosynthesis
MAGGTRSYEFARRLVDRGHDVDVIAGDQCARRSHTTPRITSESGIVVHWLPIAYGNSMPYWQRILAFSRFVRGAAAVAAKLRQDLVLASSTPLTVAIPGAYAALRHRVPMVMEVRDMWPEVPIAMRALRSPVTKWSAWQLEAWAYRLSSHVIALSPGMADNIRRRFPGVAVTTIPNGADRASFADADQAGLELRSATPWLRGRPMVLYAGTIGLVNGVDYLVRMAAALTRTDPEVIVVVVGAGRMAADVRRLASALGVLGQNFFMIGPVPKKDVVAYFGACDLAVSTTINLPALHANSANKVFDALAAGRPVSVNHGGWLADTIAGSGAGLVLPPDDPVGAALAVAAFMRDAAARAAAANAARALAREHFDRDLLFEDFEGVLLSTSRTQAEAQDPVLGLGR